jgi:hypothetical protein
LAKGLKEWTLWLSEGVVGVEGSEGVGVSACLLSSRRSSGFSDIGESGVSLANLLCKPGERAPGAVFERRRGRGRWSVEICGGLGDCVDSGGKMRRRYEGEDSGVVARRFELLSKSSAYREVSFGNNLAVMRIGLYW